MSAKKLTVLALLIVLALSAASFDRLNAQSATQAATAAATAGSGKIVYLDPDLVGTNNYGYNVLDPVTKQTTPIKLSTQLILSSLALSPDGSSVAFSATNAKGDMTPNIYVTNVNGTGLRQITKDVAGGVIPSNDPPGWSPDSKQLLFVHNEIVGSSNGPQLKLTELLLANADGKVRPQRFQTETAVAFPPYSIAASSPPAWPSAGRRMLLVGEHTDTAKVNDQTVVLLVMDLDGKNIADFTQNGVFPAWSPDGSHGAIVTNGGNGILIVDAAGNNPQDVPLPKVTTVSSVAWSPDATQLAFGATDATNGTGHVYVVNIDGSNPQSIADTGSVASLVSWAAVPDDALVAGTPKGTPTKAPAKKP